MLTTAKPTPTTKHPTAPKVSAVLFDYGLVLTGPPHPPAWAHMKTLLDASEDAFHLAYWRPRHAYDDGTLTGEEYWQAVAHELHQPSNESTVQALLEADTALWTQPNPAMIAWAAALQRAGIRTGILSNLGDRMEAGVRAQCPWLGAFHHLTFSHHLRTAKPDLAIYHHAARGLDVPTAEILFVDDREDNIAAALASGMQALRYTDHAAFKEAMQAAGLAALLTPTAEAPTTPSS